MSRKTLQAKEPFPVLPNQTPPLIKYSYVNEAG